MLFSDSYNDWIVKHSSCKIVKQGSVLVNRNNTSEESPSCPKCGTWIDHWQKLSEQNIPNDGDCAIKGCNGRTKDGELARIEGCHVMIKGDADKQVYIAPLCSSCNHKAIDTELVVDRDITLVHANFNATCAKLKSNA